MEKIKKIIDGQKEFQRFVDFPVDSLLDSTRNEISEKYLFKMIEEIIELRKEFPSVINPWSKSQKLADLTRVKEELSDVILFLVNFINVWKFTSDDLLETIHAVQKKNFDGVKVKKMNILNSDILKVPTQISGVGSGNLTPKYIFVGQNPGKDITQGYKFFSNPTDGSSKVLLPILENLGVLQDCYFTNIVKCTTEDNKEPSEGLTKFYESFLIEELSILGYNQEELTLIAMGDWTYSVLSKLFTTVKKIPHPSYVLRGRMDKEQYEKEIDIAIS